MDILSHALWTNLVFKELLAGQRSIAVVFGIMPDIISFSNIMIKNFLIKTMYYRDPPLSAFPRFVFKLYDLTHSLVIWLGIFFIFYFLDLYWLAIAFCGWGLHILLDVFTHTTKFFPTPILWPFSRFHFSGINWSNKWFMMFNYAVLVFLYLVFYF